MTDPSGLRIERRTVTGTPLSLSALTLTVDPSATVSPSADAQTVALLKRARARGVTTFDVANSRFPDRAERLIALAFRSPDPELAVIVGRSVESLSAGPGSTRKSLPEENLRVALERSLETSQHRLGPAPLAVVEWVPGVDDPEDISTQLAGAFPPDRSGGRPLWAVRVSAAAGSLPKPLAVPPVYSGDLSLLDRELAILWNHSNSGSPASLLARNPFADGRLDGSRFAAAGTRGGPEGGPVNLRELHTEFDPVLRLGFLTEGRRRTLAQAALRFVLGWPWVATAVIPLPSPERFDEILGFGSTPPLSEEERSRLGPLK